MQRSFESPQSWPVSLTLPPKRGTFPACANGGKRWSGTDHAEVSISVRNKMQRVV